MPRLRSLGWLLCCSFTLTGCATSRLQAPTLLPTNAYPFAVDSNGVTIATDPYFAKGKANQVFSQDLVDLEILPVWTVIDNQSPSAISLPREQAYLVSPGGKVYPAVKADVILPKLQQQRENAMGAAAGSMGLIGALTFLAMTSTWGSSEQKNLDKLVRETTWLETGLLPGERRAGFLYFDLPGAPSSLDGYKLRFETRPREQTTQTIEVALNGSRK